MCHTQAQKDDGYLSFSGEGLSFTINYDRNNRTDKQLNLLERALVATVIKFGGKIYLSKFPYITAEECDAMYKDLSKAKQVKQQIDPNNVFATQASQRLLGL